MPDHVSDRIPEWRLQASVAADLDKRISQGQPFAYSASLEGVRLTRYQALQAKATGMKAGEPDLRLYFANSRLVFVEMKADGGRLNADQKKRIPILHGLGFDVHVVKAVAIDEAVALVGAIVDAELAVPGSSRSVATLWEPKA